MVALCLPLAEFMAREVYESISGIGTSEGTLIEILCSGTNQNLREMDSAYQKCKNFKFSGWPYLEFFFFLILSVYGHPLEQDIKGDTSGDFELLLISLIKVNLLMSFFLS